jgi:hypothetical protein
MYPHSPEVASTLQTSRGRDLIIFFGHSECPLGRWSAALLFKDRRHKKIRIGWDGYPFRGQCQPSIRHFKIKRAMRGVGLRQVYAPSGEPHIFSRTGHRAPRHPASGLISTTTTVSSWHLGHSKVRRSRLVSSGSIKTSHIGVSQELHHRWFCIRSCGRA